MDILWIKKIRNNADIILLSSTTLISNNIYRSTVTLKQVIDKYSLKSKEPRIDLLLVIFSDNLRLLCNYVFFPVFILKLSASSIGQNIILIVK